MNKTTILQVQFLVHFWSLQSLHAQEVNFPYGTIYEGRKHRTTTFLPFLILCVIPKNSSLWKIASIWHFKEVGVNATKFVFCYVTKMHWPRGPGRRHTGTRQLVITLAILTLFYKLLIQKDSFIYKHINSVLLELCCFTLAREPLLLLKLKGTV